MFPAVANFGATEAAVPGSKNRRLAARHEVGKTTVRERTLKARRERAS